jgi:hypothetical protein
MRFFFGFYCDLSPSKSLGSRTDGQRSDISPALLTAQCRGATPRGHFERKKYRLKHPFYSILTGKMMNNQWI